MYTYSRLLYEVNHLAKFGAETGAIGFSADGRLIPYIFAGDKRAEKKVIITGGIHAREHISCFTVMKQAYFALNRLSPFSGCGIYFVPMLNPDGNEILRRGALALGRLDRKPIEEILRGKNPMLYKANGNGVDLNVNFDAGFGTGKQNVFKIDTENYVGERPFSEPETRAIRDFTLAVEPVSTVSYHATGREIYYEFYQDGESLKRDLSVAEALNQKLGYKIVPSDGTSAGGYKDWCVSALSIPSFTIELVDGGFTHPFLNYSLAKEDVERNLDLPFVLLSVAGNRENML
jgi:hypothetical protein